MVATDAPPGVVNVSVPVPESLNAPLDKTSKLVKSMAGVVPVMSLAPSAIAVVILAAETSIAVLMPLLKPEEVTFNPATTARLASALSKSKSWAGSFVPAPLARVIETVDVELSAIVIAKFESVAVSARVMAKSRASEVANCGSGVVSSLVR